jgi:hypothetical protein
MNTLQVASAWPKAFDALPECYKADDCLYFWEETKRNIRYPRYTMTVLYARPADGQEYALGNWVMQFDYDNRSWVPYKG